MYKVKMKGKWNTTYMWEDVFKDDICVFSLFFLKFVISIKKPQFRPHSVAYRVSASRFSAYFKFIAAILIKVQMKLVFIAQIVHSEPLGNTR